MNIFDIIELEEDFSNKPYYCSENYPTIGFGLKIGPQGADLSLYQFTVSREVAKLFLSDKTEMLSRQLSHKFEWFNTLNQARQDILVSMCYQLGLTGFLGFKKTIDCIANGKFKEAAAEMLDSKWHTQTEERANRHSIVMRTGTTYGVY